MACGLKLFGLVLAGGRSRRMKREKGLICYHGVPQVQRCFELLSPFCEKVFLSVRPDQNHRLSSFPIIQDSLDGEGPIIGILSAMKAHPKAAWMVLACDLPFVETATLATLRDGRDAAKVATVFRNGKDGLPEPLCAIYEPSSALLLMKAIREGHRSPRKVLAGSKVRFMDSRNHPWLQNVNSRQEYEWAMKELGKKKKIQILYFASLREQRGVSEEVVQTSAKNPGELYQELKIRNGFKLEPRHLKVAVNDEFQGWNTTLKNHDRVAFLPPVAGG